jgi:hypothetical protein
MHGIHDVFPANDNDANDPISKNKLMKREGVMLTAKTILGFDFDRIEKQCGWNPQNATNS